MHWSASIEIEIGIKGIIIVPSIIIIGKSPEVGGIVIVIGIVIIIIDHHRSALLTILADLVYRVVFLLRED